MSDDKIFSPEHNPEENENYRLAHKYIERYAESLVDEYKVRKENAVLLQRLDQISGELQDIKGELAAVREQNTALTESFRYLDFTRLTIGMGQAPAKDDPLEELKRFLNENAAQEPPAATVILPSEAATVQGMAPAASAGGPAQSGSAVAEDAFRETFQPGSQTEVEERPPEKKPAEGKKKTGKRRPLGVIANVIFYLCLVLLVVGAVAFSQSDDPEKSLFGYRYYYIKTASMEPVLPVGSVVITKAVPTEEIQVGDDITVYVGDGSSDSYLTHRVVELTTDQSGELAFMTKGVNNRANDPAPYNEKLVVGKVVFCIPKLGVVMTFVRSQLWLVIGIFVLLLALSFMLRLLFSKEPEEGDSANGKKSSGKKKGKKKQIADSEDDLSEAREGARAS